jgi:methyl-accepting chemotaxis protein
MRIEIHHYIHQNGDESQVLKLLKQILNLNTDMAKKIDEINEQLDEINSATNNIAADLDRLANQTDGGLSPQEAESVTTRLRESATALRAVANRNPEEETPPPTPEA